MTYPLNLQKDGWQRLYSSSTLSREAQDFLITLDIESLGFEEIERFVEQKTAELQNKQE